jgi:hypothetical protein
VFRAAKKSVFFSSPSSSPAPSSISTFDSPNLGFYRLIDFDLVGRFGMTD